MATKSTGSGRKSSQTTKRGTSSRKTTSKKNNSRKEFKNIVTVDDSIRDEAILLCILGVSILIYLALFGALGAFGKILANLLFGLFGIISFNVKGYKPDEIGRILDDEFSICVRTGYHCAPFVHNFLGTTEIGGTIRIGVSFFNNKKDISYLINALKTL